MELEDYKKHYDKINNLYENLYKTYMLELSINNMYKNMFNTVSDIKYMKKNLLFNMKEIESIHEKLNFDKVVLSDEEKLDLKDIRTTKYISYVNVIKEIKKLKIDFKLEEMDKEKKLGIFPIISILFILQLILQEVMS
jgi:hypothetical protein